MGGNVLAYANIDFREEEKSQFSRLEAGCPQAGEGDRVSMP
jgi:hypothetical protein